MEVRAAPLGGGAATSEELVEQFQGKVGFFAGDGEGGRQGEDVLIISAHVEHQAVLAPAGMEVSRQALGKNAVSHLAVGSNAVLLGDLHAQRESQAVHVADRAAMPVLEAAKPGQEIAALFLDQAF